MLYINLSIILLFLICFLISLRRIPPWVKDIDKNEHKLYFLYPLVEMLLSKSGLYRFLKRKEQVTDSIKALYITNKPELIQKLFWCNRISLVMVIVILFNVISIFSVIKSNSDSVLVDGKYIPRPEYGEGDTKVELKVTLEQKDNSKDKNSIKSQEVILNVKEQAYTEKELEKMFLKSMEYLKIKVLGENETSEAVSKDLNFINQIPGTSITVEWRPKDYKIIQMDGTVNNDNINFNGVKTSVTAILSYRNQQKEYEIPFTIVPKQYSEEEKLQIELTKEIDHYSEETAEEDFLELPVSLNKYRLSWEGKEDNSGVTLFFLGIVAAIIVWVFGEKELDKQMKKRKEQMLIDYPEIINKFTLLVNAGMTVKQAWNKVAEDYSALSEPKNRKKRYAYEEMRITSHELQLGLPENIAYEQYGRRIGLIPYIKFSSLISQNLKKGNKGFTDLLMKESIEAFEERKEIAKRLGEEAGTKLLMPMMVMLILVFLIIMIPAFRSFGI